MPAVNVATTDTFEIQRQKINQIGDQIFNVTAGGSDLSTGLLKLGDGTKTVPSLSFTSDSSLGLFKSDLKSIGFVSGFKRILDIKESEIISFKDFIIQNKILSSNGTAITSVGSNHDVGTYTDVSFLGGTGSGATADIIITEFLGEITTEGKNYLGGSFTTRVDGGSGTGAEVSFNVDDILGNVSNVGSGYVPGLYPNVSLTNIDSIGSGATADINIIGSISVNGTITNSGTGYAGADGTYSDISLTLGSGSGIIADITLTGGIVTDVVITSVGTGYQVNDVLEVDPADLAGDNTPSGSGFQWTIDEFIYNGTVDSITIVSQGINYQKGDILSASDSDLGGGGGSGFSFTIESDPGIIKNLEFSNKGSGYQVNDILTLPGQLTGINANLKSSVIGVTATLGTTSIIIVSDTTGIVSGMQVSGGSAIDENTTVVNVLSSTEIEISTIPLTTGSATIDFVSPGIITEIELTDASLISVGSFIIQTSGTGILANNTKVLNVDLTTNIITIDIAPLQAGTATLTFNPPYGVPTENLNYTITSLGSIDSFVINKPGSGYDNNDLLSVSPQDLTTAIDRIVTSVAVEVISFQENVPAGTFSVGDIIDISGGESGTVSGEIYEISTSEGNIDFITIESLGAAQGATFTKSGVSDYTINTVSNEDRYSIDGVVLSNLTLFVGNIYRFDISDSSNSGKEFSFSKYRDGVYEPSLIQGISGNLISGSTSVIVSDTTGIISGMQVSVSGGSGQLISGTTVVSVDSLTTITLSNVPLGAGDVILNFVGVEYTDNITFNTNELILKVTEETPNLYYYDKNNPNAGGLDGVEALVTIDSNNPKTFGSGLQFVVIEVSDSNVITGDVETGQITSIISSGQELNFENGTINTLISNDSEISYLTTTTIKSNADGDDKIDIFSGTNVNIASGNFNIGNSIQIENLSGNITSSGVIKSTNKISSNSILEIVDNKISVVPGQNLLFEVPSSDNQIEFISNSSIVIPSGNTSQRPLESDSKDGAIRFNTDTNQYEGYSETNSSWSSLGGVRDLDGNTTILAEETVGANDNTLWFINDNINTVRFTPTYQEFVNVKKLRSVNTSAPDYENWTANTPVTAGDYLKYRNNIYEVITDGTTASSGNEPIDTTGNTFTNGTATLQYFTTAVAPLTFEEISELRVDPLGFTDLVVNGDLRFSNNVISTDINDLVLRPNSGQKVTVNSNTSLVIPVGDNNSRGNAARGSIRFNTSILQYEGYDGTNWSSLGGVRDVDGNTYIIPELSPGSNENTLFFYNNNENTLRVTTTQVELDTIDTFASVTSDVINFNAATLTFDSLSTTLDNTSSTETFLFSTKDNFDFGLSVGLTTDPLVRLTTDGEIFYNSGFGTGVYEGLRLLDGDLKQFELSDVKLVTFKTTLDKGTINQGAAILYNPSIHESAKVQIVAHNTTTGDKEFIEYSVVDNGTDIFYTDFGNIKTGEELISTEFDFNASSEVRVTFIANTNLNNGDQIDITVVSNIIKR